MPGPWRWAWTLTLWWSIAGVGVALAMLGPTLEELAGRLELPLNIAGSLFTVRAAGYMLGAVACGYLLPHCRAALLFAVPLLVACAGAVAIPTIRSYWVTCLLFSFQGISMGVLDTGGNVAMLGLWRGSGFQEGFMHAFHFLFGIGAAIAPATVGLVLRQGLPEVSAWYVTAAVFAPSCLALLILAKGPQPVDSEKAEAEAEAPVAARIVLLTGAFLFIYVGIEVAFGGYVDLFAVRWVGESKVQAAGLTAVFWTALSLSRGVAAVVTSFVHHARYLAWHLVLAIVSIAGLAMVTWDGVDTTDDGSLVDAVLLMTFLFGFALGPLFPGALLVAEELHSGHSLPEQATGKIVGAAAAGEMCLPLLVGFEFAASPWNFCSAQLLFCMASACVFLINSADLLSSKKK